MTQTTSCWRNTSLQTTEETIQVTLPVYVTRELQLTMNFVESAGARMYNVDWGIDRPPSWCPARQMC